MTSPTFARKLAGRGIDARLPDGWEEYEEQFLPRYADEDVYEKRFLPRYAWWHAKPRSREDCNESIVPS